MWPLTFLATSRKLPNVSTLLKKPKCQKNTDLQIDPKTKKCGIKDISNFFDFAFLKVPNVSKIKDRIQTRSKNPRNIKTLTRKFTPRSFGN